MSKTRRDYENLHPGQYMEDCIHLKACRRVQKIGRSKHLLVPRYCDELCEAYCSGEGLNDLVHISDVMQYIYSYGDNVDGCDIRDIFCSSDLEPAIISLCDGEVD